MLVLAKIRQRCKTGSVAVLVRALQVAREHRLTRFGQVPCDDTKIHANASRHCALSDGYAETIEAYLKAQT